MIRLKTYSLLFLYLQKAPVLAYSHSPGVLEVINHIESYTSALSSRERNEHFIRMSHIFSVVIKMKYYLIKSNFSNFNGMFIANVEASAKISQEPQKDLVIGLIGY